MEARIKLLTVFKSNLIEFLDTTIEQFPQETDLFLVKTFFTEFCSPVEIMNYFVENLLTPDIVKMINERNEEFFLKNDSLFSNIENKQRFFILKICGWHQTNNKKKLYGNGF